jgi:hypothetical protein
VYHAKTGAVQPEIGRGRVLSYPGPALSQFEKVRDLALAPVPVCLFALQDDSMVPPVFRSFSLFACDVAGIKGWACCSPPISGPLTFFPQSSLPFSNNSRPPAVSALIPSTLDSRSYIRSWQRVDLKDVLRTQVAIVEAGGEMIGPNVDNVRMLFCADATPMWRTSATRCDILLDIRKTPCVLFARP